MNKQIISVYVFLLLFLPLLLIFGFFCPILAQESSNDIPDIHFLKELSPELVGKQASELLTDINATAERINRYEGLMTSASKEDKLVLHLQIHNLNKKQLNDIHKLTGALLALEKTEPQPKLRKDVEYLFKVSMPLILIHIDRLRSEIDISRARRIDAAPEERAAIEDEVAKYTYRLNVFLKTGLIHIEQMELLGLDIKGPKENLTRILRDRAGELSGRMELARDRIDYLEARRKATPDDTSIVIPLSTTARSFDTNVTGMEAILNLMERLELDTSVYREQLMAMTMDFSVGLMDTEAAVGLMSRTIKSSTKWLTGEGPKYLLKFIVFIAIVFIFYLLKRLTKTVLDKVLRTSHLNLSRLARRMIISTLSNIVLIFGILIALSQMGISLGPLLTGLGIAGFIVGFALQDTLGNFASGVMILLYRPYDIGDLIGAGDEFGTVNKMTLVSTSLLTLDNQKVVIPNNKIWGNAIR